ncbi:hypothetical protein BC937DRAFT_91221 [Endogone sp. FLAS-F59071]|nr:hypothetical protein BC937DRAFT_91221 [Endogone sp. FLAS-F59071]|eukprot:RUS21870.1 hypothetical protein BC937DRAFT_91221 [Endogone sp. FLAS-F59071]
MPPNSFSLPTNPQLPLSPPSDSNISKVTFAAYYTTHNYQLSVSAIRGMKRARDGYGEEEDSRQYHANGTHWPPEQETAIEVTEREIKKLRVSNAGLDTENGNTQPAVSQQIALQQHQQHQYQNHTNNYLTYPPTFSIHQDQQAQAYSHTLAQSQSYRHEAYSQHLQNPYLTQTQSPIALDKLQPFRISTRTASQSQPYQAPSPPTPPTLSDAVANTYGNINQFLYSVHVTRHGDPEQNERWWENEITGASGGQSDGNHQMASSSALASSTSAASTALPATEQYNDINSLLKEAFLQRHGRLPG